METVKAKIYKSYQDEKFIFPELEENLVDQYKLAIGLAGGGTRSFAICIGFFRALLRKIPLKDLSYISSVSGASWFMILLLYAKIPINQLLGQRFDRMNEENLNTNNFEQDSRFVGKCIADFPILSLLSTSLRYLSPQFAYQNILKKVFLEPYDLDGKIPVLNKTMVRLNRKFNNLNCISPRPESPFWICQSSILNTDLYKDGSASFVHTSMYSGCPTQTKCFGGNYVQNQGLGFRKKRIALDELNDVTVRSNSADSCAEAFIAASSSAFSIVGVKNEGNFLGDVIENLTPRLNLWGENTDNKIQFLADGAFLDNSGIISLVARGCKKVLSIISSEGVLHSSDNFSVAHLFGHDNFSEFSHLKHHLQIFDESEWTELRETVVHRAENKELVYYRKRMNVLPNWYAGVNGNYEVDLMLIFIEKIDSFDHHFDKNFNHETLGNFPYYPIFFSKDDDILSLTKAQINVTANYTEYYIEKIIEQNPDFFA